MNKDYNEKLRAEAEEFILNHKTLSQSKFATKAGIGIALFNLWLNKKPQGKVAKLETQITNALGAMKRGESAERGYIETNVTKRVGNLLKTVQRTGQIALIEGAAGIGKSVGVDMFHANPNNNSIRVFLTMRERSPSHIARAIQRQIGSLDNLKDSVV